MVEGRRHEEWNHTSHILATIENSQKAKGSKPTHPHERNPLLAEKVKQIRETISDPGQLARMMGCQVDDDIERRKRREARKAARAKAESKGGE